MTGWRAKLQMHMPEMLRHEGCWDGTYRSELSDGEVTDEHRTLTRCEFPDDGPFAYKQYNELIWPDGRKAEYETCATFRDGKLYWDAENFTGYGWQSDGLILLRLDRRDAVGERYSEMIEMSEDGNSRARTWQWFRGGKPYRRTLCDEVRTD